MKPFPFIFLFFFFLSSPVFARSKEPPAPVVLGGGIGWESFLTEDDVNRESHKTSAAKSGKFSNGTNLNLYLEWYGLDNLALGYQYLRTGFQRTGSGGSDGGKITEDLTTTAHLLTLTWLQKPSRKQFGRWGVIVGTGTSQYKYKISQEEKQENGNVTSASGSETYTLSGRAQMLSGFLQLNRKAGWGGRVGATLLNTFYADKLETGQGDNHTVAALKEENQRLEVGGTNLLLYLSLDYTF